MKKTSTIHVFPELARKLFFVMAFVSLSVFTYAQQRVTGTVTDAAGQPVIGANVLIEGTMTGTTTGIDGRYSIEAPADAQLSISYIGYKSQTVAVAGKTTIDVQLAEDAAMLDDVVVIGYGTVKKRDLTGAVASVKSETITMTPTSNPMEALQGRVAGLDITRTSGQAGAGVNMQLRGTRSISADGSPLFLIDGMPGDYSTLNPNDIESIDVLKDASSTAIYGSSGANGVIIITTKKGKAGSIRVNFDAYLGVNDWSQLPEMNSPEQWISTREQAIAATGSATTDLDLERNKQFLADGHVIRNWTDLVMQTGITQNYSLSISGGSEKTQAYFSANYTDEEGQFKGDTYNVLSSTMRINHNVNKWFSAGIHTQLNYAKKGSMNNHLEDAMRKDPFGILYTEDGEVNPFPISGDTNYINLLVNEDAEAYKNERTNFNLYAQPYLRFTPLKGLSLESRLSMKIGYSTSNVFNGIGSYAYYQNGGFLGEDAAAAANRTNASISNSRNWGYKWENIVTYNFQIADDHDFTITGVTTYDDAEQEGSTIKKQGITSNTYYWTNLGLAEYTGNKGDVGSSYSMGKSMGVIGRINYAYKGKYLFSASIRYDGDSRLAEDVRWQTFPAVSAGWRISDEAFMENTRDWMDNLKLRVGYGETGTAGISRYASWATVEEGSMGFGGVLAPIYKYSKTLANPSLTWERSKSWNIGIDASFFGGRIDVVADYYITKTEDVIWNQMIPVTNGAYHSDTNGNYSINGNIAETKNRGFELTLNTRNIVKKDFKWNSSITFSTNHEEVTSLGAGATEYVYNNVTGYTLHVGDPVASYRAFDIAGVWQLGEEADAAVFGRRPGTMKVNVPGMRKVEDGVWEKTYVAEDGTVQTETYTADNPYAYNDNDKVIIGHNSPDWQLGFNNTFSYKNFDLSIYMFWRHGQMINYDLLGWYNSNGGTFPAYFNYWTPENPSNDYPALNANDDCKTDNVYASSRTYVDGSFFKIKNITLGYTLPAKICKKIGIQKLRVYGTITNPLVVAKSHLIEDYDPEMNGSLNYPLTKQLVFGVNFSF